MKKLIPILVIIGLVFVLWACNSPGGPDGPGGDAEDAEWADDLLFGGGTEYPLTGDDYPGGTIDLTGLNLLDISKYYSVTVNATLYTDEAGTTKATGSGNLAQFALLKSNSDWNNTCGPTKYGMTIDGDTTWIVPEGASGVPTHLLVQANWVDFTDGVKVKSIKVHKITFTAKTGGGEPVVYDWGTTMTDVFGTDMEWPGKSLPLSGASSISGTLGDMSLYKEVIVDAVVYDRAGNIASKDKLENLAFFTLITNNSDWSGSEIIKRYDMNVTGTTTVNPEPGSDDNPAGNRVTGANAWKGIPTDIVFQGHYKSNLANDQMAGKVELKSITFVPR